MNSRCVYFCATIRYCRSVVSGTLKNDFTWFKRQITRCFSSKDWETRENAFAAFTMGPLTDFWRQRDEAEFTGVDDIPVRFVRFRAQHHDRVVVICPGRIESYVKYAELAYDLFHSGFDVLIIDHRGQGRSGRLLADPHLGHVNRFNDYVDDLAAFWQQEVQPGPWRKRYILAHSMGGAISTLFLQRHPVYVTPLR